MKEERPLSTDEIMSICINRLVEGDWTLEECLARFPDHRESLLEELRLVNRLRELHTLQPRPEFRQVAGQRLQRRLRNRTPRTMAMNSSLQRTPTTQSRTRSLTWATVAFAAFVIVLLIAGGTTAVLATANEAAPGDFLYELDLRLERRSLDSVNNLAEATDMNLRFSQERLKEAKALAEAGDAERAQEALTAHRERLQQAAADISSTTPDTFDIAQIDDRLAAQSQELDAIYDQLALLSDSQLSESAYCDDPTAVAHPAAAMIADLHNSDPGTLTRLHCEGYDFGEVVLALVTLSEVDQTEFPEVDLELILQAKADAGGWGLLWQELGEIGRPGTPPGLEDNPREDAPGRPDEPGDRGRGQGRQGQSRSQGQGQGPGENQGQGQGPGQNQGQGRGPGENQGQGPGENQGQGQGPGENQGQGQGPGENQGQGEPPSDPGAPKDKEDTDQNQPSGGGSENDEPPGRSDSAKKPK